MNKKLILCAVAAAFAGAINGMLGAGGGIILIIFLERIFKDDKEALKKAISCTLVCMLCMSAFSAAVYLYKGNVGFSDVKAYIVPSALGGVLGALIFKKIPKNALNAIFCLLVIFAGVRMIFG